MPKTIPDTLNDLRDVGFTTDRMAELFGVIDRTIYRWNAGERIPDHDYRERVETLGHTVDLLRQVYDDDQIMAWMLRAHMTNRAGLPVSPYRLLQAGKFDAVMFAAHKLAQEKNGVIA